MDGIRHRRPALLDSRLHPLSRGNSGAIDHQLQIIGIAGHIIGINQLQQNVTPILLKERYVRWRHRMFILPVVRPGNADRPAVQCQIGDGDDPVSLRLRRRTVEYQRTTTQIQPVQGAVGSAHRGHTVIRQF
ncbi:Uncharacterised protein [Yersinia similis]|nr:Uncharacterised protein [Yersinia similis]